MKKWKALIAGVLVLCLVPITSYSTVFAEEAEEEQEAEEDPIPESYYYTIESNETSGWPQGPQIESASAVVMDMDTGVYTYSKNAYATMYPASTTKIMTTLLLVENCDLDEEITFSEIVYDLEEGSSHLGIQPGETITLRDAAYGIMLASANDISNGVAEYMAGSISAFADMMNKKAEELGCVNTHFANPHGLYSEEHYTCAHDMALIAQAAYANPVFREIATTRQYMIPETNMTEEPRYFLNHHKMMQSDSDYYQEFCTGGKTGYTEACLNTLVTFAEKDDKDLVSVVFRVNGADKAYAESTQILKYTFDNFYSRKLYEKASSRSFYDILGMHYFGKSELLQSPFWQESPAGDCSMFVTLPDTVSTAEMYYNISRQGRNTVLSYEFNGYPVGTSQGSFRVLNAPVQLPFEKDVEVAYGTTEVSSGNKIQIENLDDVFVQVNDIFDTIYQVVVSYTGEHTLTVLIAGIVVLVIIIFLIILLIFRSTSESRIQRRRRQEEKERRKREEEIEQMTTAEIEAELRAAMEQERLRKEQEMAVQLEAERAAEEQKIMEEKAHETEQLIDELEKERQERQTEES